MRSPFSAPLLIGISLAGLIGVHSTRADDPLPVGSAVAEVLGTTPDYHGSFLYSRPMQSGPANPLYPQPTGFHATLVGFSPSTFHALR